MERKMEPVTVFRTKRKMFCVVCNTKKDWKRWLVSLRPLYKGVATSGHLVCQTMIRYLWLGLFCELAGCKPEIILKVDPFTGTISGI